MRKAIILPAAFLLFVVFLVPVTDATDSPKKSPDNGKDTVGETEKTPLEIDWVKYDVGLERSRKENKKLMVEFTARWCGYCRKMRATTFKDPGIIKILDEYFVTATIDGESSDTINIDGWMTNGRNLAKEYGIRGYPTYWFFNPDGEKIAPVTGYKAKDDLYHILDYLKDDLYKTKSFADYLKDKRKGN